MLGLIASNRCERIPIVIWEYRCNEALEWQCQDVICKKKVSAGLVALKSIRLLVPRQTLLQMYEAVAFPYLDYCLRSGHTWGKVNVVDSRDCKTGQGEL